MAYSAIINRAFVCLKPMRIPLLMLGFTSICFGHELRIGVGTLTLDSDWKNNPTIGCPGDGGGELDNTVRHVCVLYKWSDSGDFSEQRIAELARGAIITRGQSRGEVYFTFTDSGKLPCIYIIFPLLKLQFDILALANDVTSSHDAQRRKHGFREKSAEVQAELEAVRRMVIDGFNPAQHK